MGLGVVPWFEDIFLFISDLHRRDYIPLYDVIYFMFVIVKEYHSVIFAIFHLR